MKRYIKSSTYVDEENWKELKAKIESKVSEFLKEKGFHDVDFRVDITIVHVKDSFDLVHSLKATIGCWHKSDSAFDQLNDISIDDASNLADYLNNIFVDKNGNKNYFYATKSTLRDTPDTYVKAEFPLGTEFNI